VSNSVALHADHDDIRTTPAIQLVGLRKHFGAGDHEVVAVDGVDLTIGEGEFFSLLGPSGSGKTTVLRMIAGFEMPTGGAILLQGKDVTHQPPYDRDVNTVFQDYALFPHMTVQQNVEYGLKVKGVGKAERRTRAGEMLDAVRLGSYGTRKPDQLSGGQRQRVALARALVNHPKVLLLDEPLGALDLKLREEMQVELKAIQRDVGITFVFVTHDQGEALSMSNRLAVFNRGRIEQVGTPREIYDHPSSMFVAGFVGTSNLVPADVSARLLGLATTHSVRPERIRVDVSAGDDLASLASDEVSVQGTVADVQYLGADCRVRVDVPEVGRLSANVPSDALVGVATGAPVRLVWSRHATFEVHESNDDDHDSNQRGEP
jgi:putative spermidine/putrescine transport system ATP-binding protein